MDEELVPRLSRVDGTDEIAILDWSVAFPGISTASPRRVAKISLDRWTAPWAGTLPVGHLVSDTSITGSSRKSGPQALPISITVVPASSSCRQR
jgi:hypothetical protein